MRTRNVLSLLAAVLLASPALVTAAPYPAKPIRIIVPFPAGSGTDTGARVLGTSSQDEKLSKLKDLGASETVNYRTRPEWDRWAFEMTGGVGVDHVVEVGGAGTLAKSLRAARVHGEVSMIGILTGVSGEVPTVDILRKHIRVLGIYVGSREMFETMNRAIALHGLRPVIDRVFPFAEAVDAYLVLGERPPYLARAPVEEGKTPPPLPLGASGRTVGPVVAGIELAYGARTGARIGEAQAAVLALDHREPQAAARIVAIGRFHQQRPARAATQ